MKTRYRFEGPTTGLTLKDGKAVRLTHGAELELDSDEPRVARLAARGHLIAIGDEEPEAPAPPPPPEQGSGTKTKDAPPRSVRKPDLAKGEPTKTSEKGN